MTNIYSVRDNIDAYQTIKLLEKKGIQARSFPIVKVNYKNIPNYKLKYDFLVITSSKSIKIFLRYIFLYKKKYKKIPSIFVIGSETGESIRKSNFFDFFQAFGNSDSLIELILSNTNLYDKGLWLCGRHRNSKIEKVLLSKKRFIKSKVVYEMCLRDNFSEGLMENLKSNVNNYFIVNSSRNIEILTSFLKRNDLFDHLNYNSVLVTMSKTIYHRAHKNGWVNKKIIEETSRKLFLDRFISLIKSKK